MRHLSVDIETYSSVELKKAGMYRYAQSPDFEIMLIGYAWDDDPVRVIDMTKRKWWGPADIAEFEALMTALRREDVRKNAYNAAFEWYCFNQYGIETPIEQWQCTMAHALYCGFPASLRDASAALRLPQDKQKDAAGSALIRLFCTPTKPTRANNMRTRTHPYHEPGRWEAFKAYCARDVESERACERVLAPWKRPDREIKLWQLDVFTNAKGVRIDRTLVKQAILGSKRAADELTAEAVGISGLANPNSVAKLTKWLSDEIDEEVPNLQRAQVTELLERGVSSEKATRILEIRQELGKSSLAKYHAMDTAVCNDGRLRGMTQYYGASRTGRYAGRIVQLQNLPRQTMQGLDFARELALKGDFDGIKLCYGSVPNTLSQLVRSAFIPSPGNVFVVADFSAIEARVISWLAGEKWRNQVFATHGKIYEASAAAMFGVPIEQVTKEMRQKGKVAELALGFGGGKEAMKRMGALQMGLKEDELPELVARWRQSNSYICGFWYDLSNTIESLMRDKDKRPRYLNHLEIAREPKDFNDEDLNFITIYLPSGRKLFYERPHFATSDVTGRQCIACWGTNQVTRRWEKYQMWHGKWTENVVQAIARDCLAEVLLRASDAGLQVAFTVHDELIVDTPDARDLDKVLEIMDKPMPWAPDLLLKGDGYVCEYYRKD